MGEPFFYTEGVKGDPFGSSFCSLLGAEWNLCLRSRIHLPFVFNQSTWQGRLGAPFFPAPAFPWPPRTTLLLASTSGFNYQTPGFLECIPRLPHCFMPHRAYPLHRGNKHRRGRSERDKDRALLGGKLFSFLFLHPALGLPNAAQIEESHPIPLQVSSETVP